MDTEGSLLGQRVFGVRVIAIVEIVLILAALVVIDLLAGHGQRFWGVNPHPFWIVVLLVSAQYGPAEGLVAAISASAALLLGNLPALEFGQDPYDYAVSIALNPAMWLVTGLVVGELRGQADRRAEALTADLERAQARESYLAGAAERLALANRALEGRVAGQLRTVASLYEASRAVEQLGTGDVLIGISSLVRAAMNPAKFSLYLLNSGQLEAVANEGWGAGDSYTRVFGPSSALYHEVVGKRRRLCTVYAADQSVLGPEGLMAGPIVSAETGQVLGMLKIERMGALDFNMTAVESFRVLCEWIGTAFARAQAFEKASRDTYLGTGGTLAASVEQPLTHFLNALAHRAGFDLCALEVQVAGAETLDDARKLELSRHMSDALRATLRETDIACERRGQGFEVVVLMPVCTMVEARRAADRLKAQLAQRITAPALKVSIAARALCEQTLAEVAI